MKWKQILDCWYGEYKGQMIAGIRFKQDLFELCMIRIPKVWRYKKLTDAKKWAEEIGEAYYGAV